MQDLHAQPRYTRESPKHLPLNPSTGGPRRKRVLVMDDEIPILDLTVRLLATRGYEVETATDGGMAVERYRAAMEAGNRFDVVILDLTVPEKMGGYDAFKAMREFDPEVKAIVSSGYSHEPVVLNYKDYGIAGVAPKPYRVSELLGAVDAVANRG